jgi:uncharacterized RDD family membrane protein YckC
MKDGERVHKQLAWSRIVAWLIDWLCILILPALLVPVGLLLRNADLPVWSLNAGAFVVLIVPVTCWLAWCESGERQATPGKRVRNLQVVGANGRITFRRALLRNTLKVAVPWELGHTVAYGFASGSDGAWLIVVTIVVYAVLIAWFVSLFFQRSPYDVLSGTRVVRSPER